jgi:YcxB-like protein
MEFAFSYNKPKVIQALRIHFTARKEIKVLLVVVNIFAATSAILFYLHKIRPEPFLLGTFIWLMLMLSIWYILPYSIYKKTQTFKDHFTLFFNQASLRIENEIGYTSWQWHQFATYFESTHFFHVYFNSRSFFLIPKEEMSVEMQHEMRAFLSQKKFQENKLLE